MTINILLNKVHSVFFNEYRILENLKFNSLGRYSIRIIANWILPVYLKNRKSSIKQKKNCLSKPLIISLTSFPKRISSLWLTIETLLRQTIKADKILLYLSKEQFPHLENDLPINLLKLKAKGLDIIFVEGDIRSHKKYYYVMKSYPQALVITADDDIFYPNDMVENLLMAHQNNPKAIICSYARQITKNKDDKSLESSTKWPHIRHYQKGDDVFFGTGGGVLFQTSLLHEDTLNLELALKLCPFEDDLWLNTMTRLKKTPIVAAIKYKDILPVLIKENSNLYSSNIIMTDKQMENVISYYKNHELYPYNSN